MPNQYTMVNTNTEFFNGNQWIHMPDTPAMRRLAKPTFNIIKRVTSLFVASLTSSNTTISFEPLSYRTDGEAAAFATAEVRESAGSNGLDAGAVLGLQNGSWVLSAVHMARKGTLYLVCRFPSALIF